MSILITKYILVKSGHFSLMYYFGWNQFLFSGRNWLFKNLFIYFNWRVITLYIVLDLSIPWHESAVGVHVFSILNPLPTPSHPIPQGHPSAPALSTLSRVLNLDWQSITHMIINMFQCHSLKSHPRLLPQSPKVCSLYLCLPCCLAYRVIVAAAAAKSLQLCPALSDPMDCSPPGFPVPGILQARTLEWVAISFSNAWKWKVKVKSLSLVLLLATPWTTAYQAPLSMEFSRQEYWSGLPLPSLRAIVTIFLNSIYIYINILYWCFSFWLTSLYIIDSSFIQLIRMDSNAFFLMAE